MLINRLKTIEIVANPEADAVNHNFAKVLNFGKVF